MLQTIERSEFSKLANRKVPKASGGEKTQPVRIEGVAFDLIPKKVADDKSLGFTAIGKILVPVEFDGQQYVLPCQISGHVTVIGTKPKAEAA